METIQELRSYDRVKDLKEFDASKAGVRGLSDSGITSIPRIFVHPPESLSDINTKSSTDESQPLKSIPLIDLSGINSPSDRPNLVDQIKKAANEWGFFQVINHGIPVSVLSETLSSVEAFHSLPNDAKAKHYRRLKLGERGVMYTSNNDLFLSSAANWDDTLQVWQKPVGPDEEAAVPEICRRELLEWFSHATGVAEKLVELLAEGLGLDKGRFKEPKSFLENRILAGHCYPPCPEPNRTMGFGSHTDGAFLTVLTANQVAGLQVKHEGVWVDVKPQIGALVVNIGDFLQILSNGEYNSVQHRVLANSSKKSRNSVVIFFSSNFEDDFYYGPLPELLTPEKPAIYRPVTKEDLLDHYNKKAFGNKSLVEAVTISN